MKVQDNILNKWKESKVPIFILYKEFSELCKIKGEIICFDNNTITISSTKNFLIIDRKGILKIKGAKWQ